MNKKDYRLFLSLLLWALLPSVYLLIRMQIVSVNNVNIDILGQMEWFDLIDEIIVTTLTVPLYSLLKESNSSKEKNGLALILSFVIYALFTLIICLRISNIAEFMNAAYAGEYLLLQSVSMLLAYVSSFMIIIFTLNSKDKTVRVLCLVKLILLVVLDYVLICRFKDLGASFSEMTVNGLISVITLFLGIKEHLIGIGRVKPGFIKSWGQTGIYAGMQIFLDNFFYAVMICKMVNAVAESGNYWVANNFIWGWLLVPVHCTSEIIKKNNLEKLDMNNCWKYIIIIPLLWIGTMPLWKWFIGTCMAVEASPILSIVYPNIPFYVTYIATSFIDSWFISKGKTHYIAFISLLVNGIYYGLLYIGFKNGMFVASMKFVILMFGFGMVFHLLISLVLYMKETKSPQITEKKL